jgi:hypothetical protein
MRKQAVNITKEERDEAAVRTGIWYTHSKKKNDGGEQFGAYARQWGSAILFSAHLADETQD